MLGSKVHAARLLERDCPSVCVYERNIRAPARARNIDSEFTESVELRTASACGGPATVEPSGATGSHAHSDVQQLERWANGSAVDPDERIRKDQLKALLSAPEK